MFFFPNRFPVLKSAFKQCTKSHDIHMFSPLRATAAVNTHRHSDEAKSNITSKPNERSEQTHFGKSVFILFFSLNFGKM